jgi:hypothetical protein
MRDIGNDASVSERKSELLKGLEISRINTVGKLRNLVEKMQINGLWLMYKQMERDKKPVNYESQQ